MAYVVCAKWTAHEGKQDRLVEVIEEMTAPSRAEPGNLYYQAQRSPWKVGACPRNPPPPMSRPFPTRRRRTGCGSWCA